MTSFKKNLFVYFVAGVAIQNGAIWSADNDNLKGLKKSLDERQTFINQLQEQVTAQQTARNELLTTIASMQKVLLPYAKLQDAQIKRNSKPEVIAKAADEWIKKAVDEGNQMRSKLIESANKIGVNLQPEAKVEEVLQGYSVVEKAFEGYDQVAQEMVAATQVVGGDNVEAMKQAKDKLLQVYESAQKVGTQAGANASNPDEVAAMLGQQHAERIKEIEELNEKLNKANQQFIDLGNILKRNENSNAIIQFFALDNVQENDFENLLNVVMDLHDNNIGVKDLIEVLTLLNTKASEKGVTKQQALDKLNEFV